MRTRTLPDSIVDHPFFAGLPANQIAIVSGCASNVHFRPGEFLLLEGREADAFYVIKEGKIAVEIAGGNRGPIVVETVEGGDILGWSWLLRPYRWHFDARAMTSVSAISFDAVCLREKCMNDPSFGYEMLSRFIPIVVQRLTATRMQLLDLYQ